MVASSLDLIRVPDLKMLQKRTNSLCEAFETTLKPRQYVEQFYASSWVPTLAIYVILTQGFFGTAFKNHFKETFWIAPKGAPFICFNFLQQN